jgi:GT2 family glycosyltransferase/glycosyltransferase involved in cell wall biosynthesis
LINVIVPVYRGLQQTRRCLESVMSAQCETPHALIAIDDASPEPAISDFLRSLAGEGRIRLVTHAQNLGFVASVNEGMRLDADRDVILLNSDTEVADGWLDRLAACARREPLAGTVTPFSNNATICSYPRPHLSNPLPQAMGTAELDRLFASANAQRSVDIPTAVGFCMYITAACRARIGLFDEEAFGKGYGEEVDFCLRATKAGLRNVLAADVFVFHEGEVSFGEGSTARKQAAQAIVDARHPEFQPMLRDFLDRDPVRALRRSVDLARLRASPRPRILFVSHNWGGGVQRHVDDLASLLEGDCEVLLLQPELRGGLVLRWLRAGEDFQAWFEPGQAEALMALLREAGVDRLHFHHLRGLPEFALDLPAALDLPYDVTLHDYMAFCPQNNLADASGRYCGEPDESGCLRCLEARPPQWPLDIVAWRARFDAWLRSAARVIAPSSDLAARMQRRFPGLAITVWPHFESTPAVSPSWKVAVPGGLSAIKGLDLLEACVSDARSRGLPLHFHVIGHLDRTLPTWPEAPLTIGGTYPDGHLDELIALERADAILFLSQVPESYSYTLSAAMRSALPIVAPDLGALPERLRDYPRARLVPWNGGASIVNDALLDILQTGAALPPHRVA